MNGIGNSPVTTKDIELAEKIFGPDIGSLKGKTTRRNPIHVVEDTIDIPRELIRSQQDITLCIDGMKVNGLWFLTTISRNLYYRTAQYVKHQTIEIYKQVLSEVIQIYNNAGMKVSRIHADNEFCPLLDPIRQELDVHMVYANPQSHVPESECNNRTIKERVRAAYHRLPYKQLTRTMTKILVMEQTKKLNFFPNKHGVSKYYSPRMIVHQQALEYHKHCKYAFGTYVQVTNEPTITNTNTPHTLDCIYLRYTDGAQQGHDCLHLPTNRIVTRARITPIPITPGVITHVNTVATQEHMPKGLQISSKSGVTLYDSAWIAGVDFEDSDYDEDDDSDYSDTDDDSDESNDSDESTTSENESEDDDNNDDDDDSNQNNETESNSDVETTTSEKEFEEQEWDEDPVRQTDTLYMMPNEERRPEQQQHPQQRQETREATNTNDQVEVEEPPNPIQREEHEQTNQDNEQQKEITTRSGRVSKPPAKYKDYQSHLQTQVHPKERTLEYNVEEARVIATILQYFEVQANHIDQNKAKQFLQTYSLRSGLRKFGEKGKESTRSEMQQLVDREVFYAIRVDELTMQERKRAMESLLFIVEKRDGRVKSRFCANGSTQREYMQREESASPTVMTESVLITAVIDAKQNRDVMTCDIPNAFVQTEMKKTRKGERVVMKICGALVDILTEMDYDKFDPFVTYEKGHKVLYVVMSKALYGMLDSSLLYYKKFRKDIEEMGYIVNPYDPCVANKKIDGKQHTVCWHVDDLKASHVNAKVNDKFLKWLNKKYGTIAEVKATRGRRHDYLAMIMIFVGDGTVIIDMSYYVKKMVAEFPSKLRDGIRCPWTERLFKVDDKSPELNESQSKTMYTFVMKGMFVCKRSRQDIQPAIAFLSTRVQRPTEQDYQKLVRLMSFLKTTSDDVLILGADDEQSNEWWIDASFAVHPDYKSHTGAVHSLGNGVISSISTKQKVNSRSSTEAELIGIDDVISKVLWTKRFIESQGFELETNVIYRDNTSSMKLEENGRMSASKRTRHFNIRYFYVTDLIQRREVMIKYCPTEEMMADYFTKPLVGSTFEKMRAWIMNNK